MKYETQQNLLVIVAIICFTVGILIWVWAFAESVVSVINRADPTINFESDFY